MYIILPLKKIKKWLKYISTGNMLSPHEFGQIPLQMVTQPNQQTLWKKSKNQGPPDNT